jgi:hypothetical protein
MVDVLVEHLRVVDEVRSLLEDVLRQPLSSALLSTYGESHYGVLILDDQEPTVLRDQGTPADEKFRARLVYEDDRVV